MAELIRVWISETPDGDADTSYIGTFGNVEKPGAIDTGERGPSYYRYFYPANPEYGDQNWTRMQALERMEWRHVGLRAGAEIKMASGCTHKIMSPGLWGIESDSDLNYLDAIVREEIKVLHDDLVELGIVRCSLPPTQYKNLYGRLFDEAIERWKEKR